MRRVPDVFDCWFEYSARPFAQVHSPLETKGWLETHSPADYIEEHNENTRGRFYTLHVQAPALLDGPAATRAATRGPGPGADGRTRRRTRVRPGPRAAQDEQVQGPLPGRQRGVLP